MSGAGWRPSLKTVIVKQTMRFGKLYRGPGDEVPMDMIAELYDSMPRRLKKIRKCKGGNTKYYI